MRDQLFYFPDRPSVNPEALNVPPEVLVEEPEEESHTVGADFRLHLLELGISLIPIERDRV